MNQLDFIEKLYIKTTIWSDQEIGIFCQKRKRQSYLLEKKYNHQDNGGNPPKRCLAEMRFWFMNKLKDFSFKLRFVDQDDHGYRGLTFALDGL